MWNVKNDDSVKEAPAYCQSFLDGLHIHHFLMIFVTFWHERAVFHSVKVRAVDWQQH